MKIGVRGTAVPEGQERQQTLCCLHYFTQNHLISSFSFVANEHWQKITAASSHRAHSEHEAGHVSPHTRGNSQTPREEGPEEGPVCHQQRYSSPGGWGGIAAICSVTCGDKGHPPRVTRDIPRGRDWWDGRKDRHELFLHRAAAWKTQRAGFKPCFDHMAP